MGPSIKLLLLICNLLRILFYTLVYCPCIFVCASERYDGLKIYGESSSLHFHLDIGDNKEDFQILPLLTSFKVYGGIIRTHCPL